MSLKRALVTGGLGFLGHTSAMSYSAMDIRWSLLIT